MYICSYFCWGFVFGPCFVVQCLVPFYLCNNLDAGKKELIPLHKLTSYCSVTISVLWLLSHCAVGWSAVCDCGIL